jgi:hypothetical protein
MNDYFIDTVVVDKVMTVDIIIIRYLVIFILQIFIFHSLSANKKGVAKQAEMPEIIAQ